MTDTTILDNFQSPTWWISVVIVGLIVNVIGQFLYSFIVGRYLATSTWWQNRQKAKDLKYEADLQALRDNPHEVAALEGSERRYQHRSLESLIKAVAWGAFAIFLIWIGATIWITLPIIVLLQFSWSFYLYQNRAAMRAERLLRDFYANKQRDQI
jgi:hypothetical protein